MLVAEFGAVGVRGNEVQLLLVGDVVVGDRLAAGPGDDEREGVGFAGRRRRLDVGQGVAPVAGGDAGDGTGALRRRATLCRGATPNEAPNTSASAPA